MLPILWAIVMFLAGARFLALLANANRESELIDGLYRYSEFWVEPFFNMFGLSNEGVGGGTLEPASALAFIVYLLIGVFALTFLNATLLARLRHI